MYTKDAVLLGADGAVARTRKLIGENLQRAVPRIGGVQMTVDDFDLSGEMVYIAGRFTYDLEQRGGGVLRQVGPFSMVLRRDFGTSDWQIRSHMTPGPLVDGSDDAAPMADIGPAVTTAPVSPVLSTDTTSAELLRRAGEHYERARAAQRAEDWTTYGAEMQKLGEVLRKVGHQS
jgi:hypothetical protein